MDRSLILEQVEIWKGDDLMLRVDEAIAPGDVLTLMGPSGVGKSTLLAFITGTLPHAFNAKGRVRLHGQDITDVPPNKRRVGILFQDDLLFPHLSVGENMAFGLAPGGSKSDRREKVTAALLSLIHI